MTGKQEHDWCATCQAWILDPAWHIRNGHNVVRKAKA